MKYQLNALAAVFLIQISCAAYAGEMNDCPSSLRVAQTVQGGKGNWQPFDSNENHPFVGVSFSDGPPNLKVILAPDREQKTKTGILAIWNFLPSEDGHWVSCLYAETSATVARKLPAAIRSCQIEYDERFSSTVAKTWRCE